MGIKQAHFQGHFLLYHQRKLLSNDLRTRNKQKLPTTREVWEKELKRKQLNMRVKTVHFREQLDLKKTFPIKYTPLFLATNSLEIIVIHWHSSIIEIIVEFLPTCSNVHKDTFLQLRRSDICEYSNKCSIQTNFKYFIF